MNMFTEALKMEQRRILRLADLGADYDNAGNTGTLSLERRGSRMYCYEQRYQDGKRIRKQYLGTPDSEEVRHYIGVRMQQEQMRRLAHNRKLLEKVAQEYEDYDPETLLNALPASYRNALDQIARDRAFRIEKNGAFARDPSGTRQGILPGTRPGMLPGRQPGKLPDVMPEPWKIPLGSPAEMMLFEERFEEVKRWAAGPHERNAAPFSEASTYAKDGTHVRSKGECICHNLLQEHGLPFVYDCYMTFTNQNGETKRFCPDFVIRCLDSRLAIIEHLGKLYDLGYCMDVGRKLNWYLQSGFVLGQNLFLTSDDLHGGTDSQAILRVVQQIERLFYGY